MIAAVASRLSMGKCTSVDRKQSPQRSDSNEVVSDCSTRTPSVASEEPDSLASTEPTRKGLVVFDWDDTLFPTQFVSRAGDRAGRTHAAQLKQLAFLVESALRAAASTSSVAIVTLAQRPWVEDSAAKFLPDLHLPELLQELNIPVYYAREQGDALGGRQPTTIEDFVLLKRNAMAEALSAAAACSAPVGSCRLDVFSIGDSRIERAALRELLGTWARTGALAHAPRCKTLKLLDTPSLMEVMNQLRALVPRLASMSTWGKDFDLTTTSAATLGPKTLARFAEAKDGKSTPAKKVAEPSEFRKIRNVLRI